MSDQRERLTERLLRHVEYDHGCWTWTGAIGLTGYGVIAIKRSMRGAHRNSGAHRVAYRLLVGPIPDGLHIDHLCRNRACVNPLHLEPVTTAENRRRGILGQRASATACVNGHPVNEANSRVDAMRGSRECRVCDREAARARCDRRKD